MIENIKIAAKRLTCEQCGHRWVSISKRLPACCPNRECRSREWNGKKVQKLEPKIVIELPKPTRIRGFE